MLHKDGLPWWLSGKESACQCRRCKFNPWIGKISCRRKWQPIPVFLPGKFHGQRSLAGYRPWGCTHTHTDISLLSLHFTLSKLLSQLCCNNSITHLCLVSLGLILTSFWGVTSGFKTKRKKRCTNYFAKYNLQIAKHPHPHQNIIQRKYIHSLYIIYCTHLTGL